MAARSQAPEPITPDWLRRLRSAAGATQAVAAAHVGVNKQTWSAWERGTQSPTVLAAEKLRAWYARLARDSSTRDKEANPVFDRRSTCHPEYRRLDQ